MAGTSNLSRTPLQAIHRSLCLAVAIPSLLLTYAFWLCAVSHFFLCSSLLAFYCIRDGVSTAFPGGAACHPNKRITAELTYRSSNLRGEKEKKKKKVCRSRRSSRIPGPSPLSTTTFRRARRLRASCSRARCSRGGLLWHCPMLWHASVTLSSGLGRQSECCAAPLSVDHGGTLQLVPRLGSMCRIVAL